MRNPTPGPGSDSPAQRPIGAQGKPHHSAVDHGGGQADLAYPRRRLQAARDQAAADRRDVLARLLPESADDVIAAVEDVSRRIDRLARELNCLGFFDDDDDRPRAA